PRHRDRAQGSLGERVLFRARPQRLDEVPRDLLRQGRHPGRRGRRRRPRQHQDQERRDQVRAPAQTDRGDTESAEDRGRISREPLIPSASLRVSAVRFPLLRAEQGFTLVELMVVVIILGLIGGIAVTSWASMLPNQQFNSAVRNLSEVLYGTRSDAIARNREFRIQYDLDEDTYRVRTPFKPGGGFASSEEDAEHLWSHETNLKENGIDLLQVTVDDQTYTD